MRRPHRPWTDARSSVTNLQSANSQGTDARGRSPLPWDARLVLGVLLIAALLVVQLAIVPQVEAIRAQAIEEERAFAAAAGRGVAR
jgi:hypothetical protein